MAKRMFNTDQDYMDAGVEPPKRQEHNIPGDDNAGLIHEIALAHKHTHLWKQIGNFIECIAGSHPHGVGFDHMNQILVGTATDGSPIFKDLDFHKQKLDDVNNVPPDVSNEG